MRDVKHAPDPFHRQILFLGCLAASAAQAGLGLIAYQAVELDALETARLARLGAAESIANIVTVVVALHFLHPRAPLRHRLLAAAVIGTALGAAIVGLDTIQGAEGAWMAALRTTGSVFGLLATGMFWAGVFDFRGPKSSPRRTCTRA